MSFKLDWNLKRKSGSDMSGSSGLSASDASSSNATTISLDPPLTHSRQDSAVHFSFLHHHHQHTDGGESRQEKPAKPGLLSKSFWRAGNESKASRKATQDDEYTYYDFFQHGQQPAEIDCGLDEDDAYYFSSAEELRRHHETLNSFDFTFGRTHPRRPSDLYGISPCNSYLAIFDEQRV